MEATPLPEAQLTPGTQPVLHVVFALTGVLHAIGGALLPALAASLGLSDSRSGALFLCYYIGTSLGALLCIGRAVLSMMIGFLIATACCFCISAGAPALLPILFFLLGVGVGMPMTAISIYAGRAFVGRAAAPLTLLNFSWSSGALLAPLLAARVLVHHSWRAAYDVLGFAAVAAVLACRFSLRETQPEPENTAEPKATSVFWLVALMALLTFLQVGIENTTTTWLTSFAMRTAGTGTARAAAFSSFYWIGFLLSRGLSSVALLRLRPMRVLVVMTVAALLTATLLLGVSSSTAAGFAMFMLGATLAPIFPLLLSRFFAQASHISHSRWVLAICGFGGSVLPWLTGLISSHTNSLRLGLITVPAALLLILCLLPMLRDRRTVA